MCYAKPGPRCASHAWNRLKKVANDEKEKYTSEEVEEAYLDYYSTKAGLGLLETRRLQQMDTTDLIWSSGRRFNVEEYEAAARAYHEKKIAAYKQVHGDAENVEDHTQQDFACNQHEPLELDSDGKLTPEMLEAYASESSQALHHIPDDAYSSLTWFTSDGHQIINEYLHEGYQLEGTKYEDVSEEELQRKVTKISKAIQSSKRDTPIRVYRGINEDVADSMFGDGETLTYHNQEGLQKVEKLVKDRFKPGSTFTLQNFASTSYAPQIATRFAGSNIMFEMEAKTALPVGAVSAWGVTEREYLIDQGTQYEVISVEKQPHYYQKGEHIIIRLREL